MSANAPCVDFTIAEINEIPFFIHQWEVSVDKSTRMMGMRSGTPRSGQAEASFEVIGRDRIDEVERAMYEERPATVTLSAVGDISASEYELENPKIDHTIHANGEETWCEINAVSPVYEVR